MVIDTSPTDIRLHRQSGLLELAFRDGSRYELSAEILRVFSPSAEVRGHGKGQEVLQAGKKHVRMVDLKPIGNYAIRLVFDDGHDTGIYSWDYLYDLGRHQSRYWTQYLADLQAAGVSREPLPPDTQVVTIDPLDADDPSEERS